MQLPKGPGCQLQLLLISPPGRKVPLLCLLRGPCPGHGPAVTPRTAGFWFPWALAWGQGDIEQMVNVPQQAFVLLPLLSSLMLHDFWRHTQPKEGEEKGGWASTSLYLHPVPQCSPA